jgi:hypothetical protein
MIAASSDLRAQIMRGPTRNGLCCATMPHKTNWSFRAKLLKLLARPERFELPTTRFVVWRWGTMTLIALFHNFGDVSTDAPVYAIFAPFLLSFGCPSFSSMDYSTSLPGVYPLGTLVIC